MGYCDHVLSVCVSVCLLVHGPMIKKVPPPPCDFCRPIFSGTFEYAETIFGCYFYAQPNNLTLEHFENLTLIKKVEKSTKSHISMFFTKNELMNLFMGSRPYRNISFHCSEVKLLQKKNDLHFFLKNGSVKRQFLFIFAEGSTHLFVLQ